MPNTDAERVQYAINMLQDAVRGNVISAEAARPHLDALGYQEPVANTTVTITVDVQGDVNAAFSHGNGVVTERIESALVGLASQVGLTVVRGSTNVRS